MLLRTAGKVKKKMYELLVPESSRTVFMITDNPDWGDNLGEEPLYLLTDSVFAEHHRTQLP